MHLAVYLPFLLSAAFGLLAPPLARAMPPGVASWLLSGGALLSAAATSAALSLLAFPLIAQLPPAVAQGHWSVAALREHNPVAPPVAGTAILAIAVLLALGSRAIAARVLALRHAYRLAAELPATGELAVLDDPHPQAFAAPGRPGRIVVTTALLRGLDAGQRRAVLAHERSHLAHRHHLHQSVVAVAAVINPLLRGLPGAVELACERWADEDAARAAERSTVADALTRAALGPPLRTRPVLLGAAAVAVAHRVQALQAPALRLRVWRVAVLVSLLGAALATVLDAAHETERLFEFAQAVHRAATR